jgi:hypothetical protein
MPVLLEPLRPRGRKRENGNEGISLELFFSLSKAIFLRSVAAADLEEDRERERERGTRRKRQRKREARDETFLFLNIFLKQRSLFFISSCFFPRPRIEEKTFFYSLPFSLPRKAI